MCERVTQSLHSAECLSRFEYTLCSYVVLQSHFPNINLVTIGTKQAKSCLELWMWEGGGAGGYAHIVIGEHLSAMSQQYETCTTGIANAAIIVFIHIR